MSERESAAFVATTYCTERYDSSWGGWRCDDVELSGVTAKHALDAARNSTRDSTMRRRVVNERTGEVIATYRRGRKQAEAREEGRDERA